MKKIFTLLFLLAFTFSFIDAQDRYLEKIGSNIEVTTEVYATNATVLFLPDLGEAVPIPLHMDIYKLPGDTATDRPVVLLFHNGNFLPNVTNGQISGTNRDSSVVELAKELALRGYVAASCEYRLGWNPLAQTQPERALGLIQAAYRGLQDGRAAVRYMRASVEESGNPHGIDPEKVVLLGVGTGGYLTLGMIGLSDYDEIVNTSNNPGKFLLDVLDGMGMPGQDGIPETPMIAEAFHGDINGEVLTVVPFDGFGLTAGDTTNYVNNPGYSNDVSLGINIGGALGDLSWLNDNTTPTLSIQHPFDIFAPYDDDVLVVPTTQDPIVQVQGANQIGIAQMANGANAVFTAPGVNFLTNDQYGVATQTAIGSIDAANMVDPTLNLVYAEGVYPFLSPVNSLGIPEGVVLNWWDPDGASPVNGQGGGAPWNMIPHPLGGTYHDQGLRLNENMSAEKSRANIAKVLDYILPRACVALELPCSARFIESNTEDVLDNTFVTVAPNPAEALTVVTTGDKVIKTASLTNLKGELLRTYNNVENNNLQVDRAALNSGIYILQLRFEEGTTTHKIVFK